MQTQASTTLTRGGCAFRLGVALLLALLPLVPASARVQRPVHHNDAWARQQFARAERMREALNGRPLGERTRREYQRVIDSYRRVYFGSPASSKADQSVVATAELMVEMGRRFDDDKILRGAIDQYRFLRREYPGSKYRFDALFTIGEIYKDDLNDPAEARTTFTDFVHRYPRNRLAADARAAAVEMARSARKTARKQRASNANVGSGANDSGGSASAGSSSDEASEASNAANAVTTRRSGLPRVTGVRHWSTPDYTRVAIDVEQEVKFGSQRISNPDRIFFDLRGTKLASTLVGKTFDVDDGFLKKIRVAEFQPGRTRIVLEVDNLASYDAFLLPDPYRLIIDVHGKDVKGKEKRMTTDAARSEGHLAKDSDPSDADDDSSAVESRALPPGRTGEAPIPTQTLPTQAKTNADNSGKGLVETDLPAADAGAESKSPNSGKVARGSGVTKTTVEVKDSTHGGTTRRIPKTIVAADADSDSGDDAKDATPPTVAARESSFPSSSSSSLPSASRRKKSRSTASASASDTADLHSDASLESRETSREARPTAAGDRSLTRALGLKIGKIVIDAGHGGHDTGTIGPNGLLEKDVVLDVAKRLGRLLESRLGAEVIYTRQDDTFIPLETRTAIANR